MGLFSVAMMLLRRYHEVSRGFVRAESDCSVPVRCFAEKPVRNFLKRTVYSISKEMQ